MVIQVKSVRTRIGNLKWHIGNCLCSQDDRVECLNTNGIWGDCNIFARGGLNADEAFGDLVK